MGSEPFKPSVEELEYLLAASLVAGAAYTAYSGAFNLTVSAFYLAISGLILTTRELGQRLVAQAMDADVKLEISLKGSMVTVFGAFMALITSLPLILLFPVYNSFSTNKYEQWGKSIDAIWLKRQFWLASGGIVFLFLGWTLTYITGFSKAAEAFSLFIIFQLMPFDYHAIPTGSLDGATILKQSGFMWLVYFATAWVTLAVVWV